MDSPADPELPTKTTLGEYRKRYREQQKEMLRTMTKKDLEVTLDVIVSPRSVDMKQITGTDKEITRAIEYLYANDGR